MKAASYDRVGPAADVLQVIDGPEPNPGSQEVRVRMHWSGVNPSDVKSRAGLRSKVLAFARIVPHSDGMGVIDAVGEGVSVDRIGERVWVWNAAWGRANGTAAQWVCLPAEQALPYPETEPDEGGACLGIPALTALFGLWCQGGVAGQTVLVAGGAGAVGHYAVQMARLMGAAQVIATVSSEEKAQVALAAGADVCIDYRQSDVIASVREASQGRGVDRVIEVDIAANGAMNAELLRPGGLMAVYGSGNSPFALPFFPYIARNIAVQFYIVYNLSPEHRQAVTSQLQRWLAAGVLQHAIAARVPLAEVARAHELVESGKAIGNVVVDCR